MLVLLIIFLIAVRWAIQTKIENWNSGVFESVESKDKVENLLLIGRSPPIPPARSGRGTLVSEALRARADMPKFTSNEIHPR